ncbi:MAG TPA: hypothetical protein VLG17_10035 [Pseudomonas sp.]|uniref:hypothetical protein n=1 Tax=Pseudomonas sp. TaxID=306 RepID=UPI002D01E9FC|nr:hypothetical protein [Pseudomonas sp.]HSX88326.1 hypothetical protein [Pseudomonas sp.]
MLNLISAEHFRQLQGQICEFATDTGEKLLLRVDTVNLKPNARMPSATEETRMPFSVGLTAVQPTGFMDGACTVDLPQLGQVSHLMVLREAALDRDPTQHYFQILFN